MSEDGGQMRFEDERQEGLDALSKSLRVSFVWLYALILVMLGVILAQSFFVVKQHELGLIFRFGRLRATVGNGWHLKWPYPVEEAVAVEVSRSKKVSSESFMFRPGKDGIAVPPALKPGVDGFLLTGDLNIVHVRCSLTYYIDTEDRNAALCYFYRHDAVEKTLQAMLDNSVLKAAASMSADDILLRDVKKFRARIAENLKAELRREPLGVTFDERKDVAVKAIPPRQAQAAFDALSDASQRQDKTLSEAEAYRIKTVSEARSSAESVKATAASYRIRAIATAKADAATFTQRLRQYQQYPDLIARSIYEDTLMRVLSNVDEKFVLGDGGGKRQLRLLLNRNLDKPKNQGAQP